MGFKKVRFSGLVIAAITFLPVLSFLPGSPTPEPGQFWQMTLKLQIRADFWDGQTAEKTGHYLLDADWSGFLEEDGPDFIIYHLGSQVVRWEVKAPDGQSIAALVPTPALKLDYVEGEEEEINFYYSFNPDLINYQDSPAGHRIKLVLPARPWSRSGEKIPWFRRKVISGELNLKLQRSQLALKEIRKEFNWVEETSLQDSNLLTVRQRSRVKILLELTRRQ